MLDQEIAQILLEKKAVALNPTQPFTFASGIKSPIYCDNRLLISHPEGRSVLVDGFIGLLKEKNISGDVIAGTATAGIPWAAWIAQKLNQPMVYVRESAKDHGRQNQIEGEIKKGQKVILIEDLISSGGSSVKAIQAVQNSGFEVVACLAIFTYQMKKASEAFASVRVPLHTLSNFSALTQVAKKLGLISDEQIAVVLEWGQDPAGWGAKHGF